MDPLTLLCKASYKNPIKAKDLKDLEIWDSFLALRKSKRIPICSKPGPKGGYYLSNDSREILACERWINNWRSSMKKPFSFQLCNLNVESF